jgi:protein-S-isoprenylcysteine O-methyltransferase Ste14
LTTTAGMRDVMGLKDNSPRMSRPAAVTFWVVGVGTFHVAFPLAVAKRTRHLARPALPAAWLAGLGSLVVGTAGLTWSLAQHFKAARDGGFEISVAPEYLLQSGPYRYSRNPMYIAELGMWTGWTLLFNNPVLAGATVLLALAMRHSVTLEEAALAARFTDTWHEYAAETPRWIGKASNPPS